MESASQNGEDVVESTSNRDITNQRLLILEVAEDRSVILQPGNGVLKLKVDSLIQCPKVVGEKLLRKHVGQGKDDVVGKGKGREQQCRGNL